MQQRWNQRNRFNNNSMNSNPFVTENRIKERNFKQYIHEKLEAFQRSGEDGKFY